MAVLPIGRLPVGSILFLRDIYVIAILRLSLKSFDGEYVDEAVDRLSF